MRLRLIWEGKTKDPHLRALQAEYARRLAHFTECVVEEIRPLQRPDQGDGKVLSGPERSLLDKLRESTKVILDVRGREWTSRELAEWLGRQAVGGTRELAFLVGRPEGFSEAFRKQANVLLALSRLTLTRDWARTLLMEQLYRSFALLRGLPYPK